MEDPLDSYPLSKCRQGTPIKRNPVCALTLGVCAELCDEYGGINFDVRKSIVVADCLCFFLAQNAWDPPDAEQCYRWFSRYLINSPPAMMCACAIVSITISKMTDAPDSLKDLGRDLRCLIYGSGQCIYDSLCSATNDDIELSLSVYGGPSSMSLAIREKVDLALQNDELEKIGEQYNININAPINVYEKGSVHIDKSTNIILNQHK